MSWKSLRRMQLRCALVIGTALFRAAPSGPNFGNGYDLALITNLLHGFDAPTCTKLMRKVRVAVNPGGRAAIAEYVSNSDGVSPPIAAAFRLTMLAATLRVMPTPSRNSKASRRLRALGG
jgi:hypothetical protein